MSENGVEDSPADFEGDTTKLHTDWRENLTKVAPEYVTEWDEFKNADSPEKFFDQLKNHRSMIGQSVRIPGSEAGEEQLSEFYNKLQSKVPGLMRTPNPDDPNQVRDVFSKLGLPEKPDDYNVAENIGIDSETLGAYRALAHEAGLTKAQFNKFISDLGGRSKQSAEQTDAQRKEDIAGLRGEWGAAFEQRAGICAKVAQRTGAPEGLCQAIEKGEADSKTMKWLYSLSTQMGSEGMNFTDSQAALPTPADIQGTIDDIMQNPQHPYWVPNHPNHRQAVDKMLDLRRALAN